MSSEKQKLQALVRDFSSRMLEKLQAKRGRGWSGWRSEHFKERLENDLLIHLRLALQGDDSQWIDVANYAAFLDYRGRQSTPVTDGQIPNL